MGSTIRVECGYCRQSLSLYRRLSKESFCSKAHERAFAEEMNLLAVERYESLTRS
jgi:hypothetical protein